MVLRRRLLLQLQPAGLVGAVVLVAVDQAMLDHLQDRRRPATREVHRMVGTCPVLVPPHHPSKLQDRGT